MDPKLRRKLIVSGGGLAAVIGIIVVAYIMYFGPRLKKWNEARLEVKTRENKLEELRKAFANQKNPQDELRVLQEEINNLQKVDRQLQKIKTPGKENTDFPKELNDPDPQIKAELFRDYMKQVMGVAENTVKEKLKSAQISPPDLKLYEDLNDADEASYYVNRANGLIGILDAMARSRSPNGTLVIDKITLEDYATGIKRREGAVNILSYLFKTTLDMQTLAALIYNLHEEDNYYFVDQIKILPRTSARGTTQQLSVEARINTTMVFQSQVQAQVQKILVQAQASTGKSSSSSGSWMAQLASSMKKQQDENKGKGERKWYQFWKWFSKE